MKPIRIILSNIFNLPVTRKQVLERAKSHEDKAGLCRAISESLLDYNIYSPRLREMFPKFRYEEAITFGTEGKEYVSRLGYWWPPHEWNGGRMMFLNWLITEYKDDKTNLRKYVPH